ncbi:glycosyltransferase [Paenarthrobacter nitroguajacolicus]|uniref:glycosyltransferase n=1 Tax=Paenarthrobacter nitroguajacolicus TaxID=211146 RepID=UPI003AE64C92
MLDQVDEWYSRGPGCELDKALNVVGPNLAKVPSGLSDANIVGWVDEIESAYSGVSCALALTKSGSGVKNKVLEPLSFGIPVIATQDALNGISYDPRMVLPFRDNLSVNEINAWLDDLEMNGRKCLNAPSWDENVATVADYLLQGMER